MKTCYFFCKINCFKRQKNTFCQNWLACLRLVYCLSSYMLSVSKVIMGRGNNGTHWMIAKNIFFEDFKNAKSIYCILSIQQKECLLIEKWYHMKCEKFQPLILIIIYCIAKSKSWHLFLLQKVFFCFEEIILKILLMKKDMMDILKK